jgi:hypothetical protein
MRKLLTGDQPCFPVQTGRGENHAETGDSSSRGSRIQNSVCLKSQFAPNRKWKINKKDFLIIIRTENTTLE